MDTRNIIIEGSQLSFDDYKEFYSSIPKLLVAGGKLTITINSTDFQEFDLGLIAYILLAKNRQSRLHTVIETGPGVRLNTAIANRLVSYKYYSEAIIGRPVFDDDICEKDKTSETKYIYIILSLQLFPFQVPLITLFFENPG